MILRVASQVAAEPLHVWRILIDWAGQSRWIPFTTIDIISDHDQGIGVRAVALSGFRLGGIPVGLLDNFVVTGWTPAKEFEVLHLGPTSEERAPFGWSRTTAAPWSPRPKCFPRTAGNRWRRWSGSPCRSCGQASGAAFAAWRRSPRAAHDGCGSWFRRQAPLPMVAVSAGVPGLSRSRVGSAGDDGLRPVRTDDPRGFPIGPVLDHDLAEA